MMPFIYVDMHLKTILAASRLVLFYEPKKKFLQDLETIRSMILQDLACKITTDFGTISREIMPE